MCVLYVFFFQAEDGIRDGTVTGVQTCALPISGVDRVQEPPPGLEGRTCRLEDLGLTTDGELGDDAPLGSSVLDVERAVLPEEPQRAGVLDAVPPAEPLDLGFGHLRDLPLVRVQGPHPRRHRPLGGAPPVRVHEALRGVVPWGGPHVAAIHADALGEPQPQLLVIGLPVLLVPQVVQDRGPDVGPFAPGMERRQEPREGGLEGVVLPCVAARRPPTSCRTGVAAATAVRWRRRAAGSRPCCPSPGKRLGGAFSESRAVATRDVDRAAPGFGHDRRVIRVRRREAESRGAGPRGDRLRRSALAAAGPLLIVAAVLVVLHAFAFGGRLTLQHVDVLSQWLPTYCFLGKSLAGGHIPAWNPFVMGGVPFAADPQSGWTYVPAMALFSALPRAAAMRWFIVLQPVLAGLGLFWFLRSEQLGRAAATTGGVVLALVIAESYIAVSIPFSGTLAWTALTLAAASRLLRVGAWPGRLAWLTATAIAWGQVAAAHLSNGLVIATLALVVFVAVRLGADLRGRRRTGRGSVALMGLLVAALPLVNLAGLVPRLAYLSRTSLSLGYRGIQVRAAELAGRHPFPFEVGPS